MKEGNNLEKIGKTIDASIQEDKNIDTSYTKAEEILKKERISERAFEELYGKDQVDTDLKYMAEHKMIFNDTLAKSPEARRAKKFASVLEGIFIERVNNGEWFGPGVSIIIPSQYDEIKNGVDSIAKFQKTGEPSSYLALAIDVTFSKKAYNKILKIQEEIRDKKVPEIKYFKTEKYQGKLLNVPKVIIGTDIETVRELSILWNSDNNEEIKNHSVQKEILSEIMMQLEKFEGECIKYGRNDLANSYNHARNVIQRIIREKGYNLKSVQGGTVYQNMRRCLDSMN